MWIEIVLFIISLILKGISREYAVQKAADAFGVSEHDIWTHGGF